MKTRLISKKPADGKKLTFAPMGSKSVIQKQTADVQNVVDDTKKIVKVTKKTKKVAKVSPFAKKAAMALAGK